MNSGDEMNVRILSEKDFQAARKRVVNGVLKRQGFCYICGNPLRNRRNNVSSNTTKDHVIPTSLLGSTPEEVSDRWSMTLDVHERCERESKQPIDEQLKAFHALHQVPAEDWKPELVKSLRPFFRQVMLDEFGAAIPAFTNANPLVKGIFNWIRGLHSILYASPVPPSTKMTVVPPLLALSATSSMPLSNQVQTSEWYSCMQLVAFKGAKITNAWDGIECRGGKINYRCLWFESKRKRRATCIWILNLPGVCAVSSSVRQFPVPWHGHYEYHEIPSQATQLTDEMLGVGQQHPPIEIFEAT